MVLLWTDPDPKHSAGDAVSAFALAAFGYARRWVWVSEAAGEFRMEGGVKEYKVTLTGGGWGVFELVTPGGA